MWHCLSSNCGDRCNCPPYKAQHSLVHTSLPRSHAQESQQQQKLQLVQQSPARQRVRRLLEQAAADNTTLANRVEELRAQRNALCVTKAALTAQVSTRAAHVWAPCCDQVRAVDAGLPCSPPLPLLGAYNSGPASADAPGMPCPCACSTQAAVHSGASRPSSSEAVCVPVCGPCTLLCCVQVSELIRLAADERQLEEQHRLLLHQLSQLCRLIQQPHLCKPEEQVTAVVTHIKQVGGRGLQCVLAGCCCCHHSTKGFCRSLVDAHEIHSIVTAPWSL